MRWKECRLNRNLSFLSISVIFCCLCFLYFLRLMVYVEDDSYHVAPDAAIQNFLVDTPGCRIPELDPWDESVKNLYEPSIRYKCKGRPSFLRVLPNAVVSLDETLLRYYYEVDPQNVSCAYQEISRDTSKIDEKIDNRLKLSPPQKLHFDDPLNVDFIRTYCKFRSNSNEKLQVFHEFLPLTPLKKDVEYRKVPKKGKLRDRPLNVIFLGLDSISYLNFLRHFPKCKQLLSSLSTVFTMKGYTKVGDNTFPNVVPLLTGHFYHYYYGPKNSSMFFDDVDFIWKTFSNLGYRTLLAEDAPEIATFNYYRSGFKNPPTDYYYRPLALALEKSEVRKQSTEHCFGNKMEMQVVYDYFKSFVETIGSDRPFFAFLFLARLTHDVLNFAGYADEPSYRLIKYLDESGVLNNSMLVFYSDHGIRYGSIRKTFVGQFEERMPFLNIYVPKWFLDKHTSFKENLKKNRNRLTTPFDIHATLLHLAAITAGDSKLENYDKPGVSLFREVLPNRTCSDAWISPHWCPCHSIQLASKDDIVVRQAASTIINFINEKLSAFSNKCARLSLREILAVRFIPEESNGESIEFKKTHEAFLIQISTSPSNAIFESTVRCEFSAETECKVIDEISRINRYGSQSVCISDVELRKFCYCIF